MFYYVIENGELVKKQGKPYPEYKEDEDIGAEYEKNGYHLASEDDRDGCFYSGVQIYQKTLADRYIVVVDVGETCYAIYANGFVGLIAVMKIVSPFMTRGIIRRLDVVMEKIEKLENGKKR